MTVDIMTSTTSNATPVKSIERGRQSLRQSGAVAASRICVGLSLSSSSPMLQAQRRRASSMTTNRRSRRRSDSGAMARRLGNRDGRTAATSANRRRRPLRRAQPRGSAAARPARSGGPSSGGPRHDRTDRSCGGSNRKRLRPGRRNSPPWCCLACFSFRSGGPLRREGRRRSHADHRQSRRVGRGRARGNLDAHPAGDRTRRTDAVPPTMTPTPDPRLRR